MKSEYNEGPEALKKFEDGMAKLFKAKKPVAEEAPKNYTKSATG